MTYCFKCNICDKFYETTEKYKLISFEGEDTCVADKDAQHMCKDCANEVFGIMEVVKRSKIYREEDAKECENMR